MLLLWYAPLKMTVTPPMPYTYATFAGRVQTQVLPDDENVLLLLWWQMIGNPHAE